MIGLLLAWAIAMSGFRTPAIALLRQCATTRYLPQAASILTLVGGVTGATAAATPIIRSWLASVSFGIAALLIAALVIALSVTDLFPQAKFSQAEPVAPIERNAIAPSSFPSSLWLRLSLIFALGFATTAVLRLVVETFPKLLQAQLPTVNPALMLTLMFITLALAALPSGTGSVRFGNRQTMLVGLGAMLASLGIMNVPASPSMAVVAAIALGSSLALVFNGTLPFTLASVSAQDAGLAVGMFFGGAATAVSCLGLFGNALAQSGISPIWLGGLALFVAALCITVPFQSNGRSTST